jgi:DegV family protein with EDD domain
MISPISGRQRVAVVTDTTASLPPGYAAAHGLEVVPQVIIFGDESYLEERELPFAEFVRRLKRSEELPRTAAPPPGEFVAAYGRALAQADTILSIHPSSEVSGTVRSARSAVEMAYPDADIRILDTRTIGGALGAMVQVAVEGAESGNSADTILSQLRAMVPRSRTYFALRTLEYLQKGGRIGKASALAGSVLRIKPVLQLDHGQVAPLEKIRTFTRAVQRLEQLTVSECPPGPRARLCVMEADARREAERLAASLARELALTHVPLLNVGSAITTHAGPGVLGVAFFGV